MTIPSRGGYTKEVGSSSPKLCTFYFHRIILMGFHYRRWSPLIFAACLLVACGRKFPPSSTLSWSPDRHWLANVLSYESTGDLGDTGSTLVTVAQVTATKQQVEVLGFDGDSTTLGLTTRWLEPSHLEVSFVGPPLHMTFSADPYLNHLDDRHRVITFRVEKLPGLTVSVHNF